MNFHDVMSPEESWNPGLSLGETQVFGFLDICPACTSTLWRHSYQYKLFFFVFVIRQDYKIEHNSEPENIALSQGFNMGN